MKKVVLALSLVPSIALAHHGHDDVGVGGDPVTHALVTNPVFFVMLFVGIYAANRIVKKVRS